MKEKAIYLADVPVMYKRMYGEFVGKDLSFIKIIVAGGDSVSGSLINRYNQLLRQSNCLASSPGTD